MRRTRAKSRIASRPSSGWRAGTNHPTQAGCLLKIRQARSGKIFGETCGETCGEWRMEKG